MKVKAVEIRNLYFLWTPRLILSLMSVLFCKAQDLSFHGVHTVMESFVHADFNLAADVILLSSALNSY